MCEIQSFEPKKILVVDDEKVVRYLCDIASRDKGYTVFYAEGAEEALAILNDENIDVMFLDLNLPDMSAIELCRRIRSDQPNAYIIAITGYSAIVDINECYEVVFDDYLEKPVSFDLLLTTTYKAFESTKKMEKAQEEMMSSQEWLKDIQRKSLKGF